MRLFLFFIITNLHLISHANAIQKIYLTIDDAPSIHMKKKIDFLDQHKIPAIFFCRGDRMMEHEAYIIEAIQKGFLIGNHSYSHPFFSQISLTECFDEILKTETLIDACYKKSGTLRPMKVIRLPYGDRGAGDFARIPITQAECTKVKAIQDFLDEQGFQKIKFEDFYDDAIDAYWTWDTQDYKKSFITDNHSYIKKFEQSFYTSSREIEILLLHDFDNNHHLFELAMQFLQNQPIEFLASEQ